MTETCCNLRNTAVTSIPRGVTQLARDERAVGIART